MSEQVLVLGNPVDGYVFYGPLKEEHSVDWIDNNFADWYIVDLHELDELED